jgi:hypothetical protein
MRYNWQQPDWPHFRYTPEGIDEVLLCFAEQTGHITGILSAVPEDIQTLLKGTQRINAGVWSKHEDLMQVVSGAIEKKNSI